MKSPVGYAQPRRLTAKKKQVRLNLRRPAPMLDDELEAKPKSHFWKWVGLVALLHVVVICLFGLIYWSAPTPPPPEPFISLLPEGDVVKGTPGTQEAPKVGPSTPAPSIAHVAPPPQPIAPPVQPKVMAPPVHLQPKPVIIKPDAPDLAQEKPVTPPKPKVKVDLHLADGPTPVTEKPVIKPKPTHIKKTVTTPTEETAKTSDQTESTPDNTGLSKQEIARKLGQKLQTAGVASAINIGPSGSTHSQANPFADFYAALRDQVMSKWESPNLTDETAVNPLVQIHVEKDGRVPPESVTLVRSSGNPTYDDSALAAARSLGYLLQPLPDGCPPDISITFKLTR